MPPQPSPITCCVRSTAAILAVDSNAPVRVERLGSDVATGAQVEMNERPGAVAATRKAPKPRAPISVGAIPCVSHDLIMCLRKMTNPRPKRHVLEGIAHRGVPVCIAAGS